jgi:hypothetical protein
MCVCVCVCVYVMGVSVCTVRFGASVICAWLWCGDGRSRRACVTTAGDPNLCKVGKGTVGDIGPPGIKVDDSSVGSTECPECVQDRRPSVGDSLSTQLPHSAADFLGLSADDASVDSASQSSRSSKASTYRSRSCGGEVKTFESQNARLR